MTLRTPLALLLPLLAVAAAPAAAPTAFTVAADAHAPALKPLPHFWSECVGAGRANEGLRASWLEQLKLAHDACGFRYVRFHGLFHDDMFVYREEKGRPVYNFQYVDDLFDRMLAIGVRPFVELSFFPQPLAGGDATQFWWKGNITPPADNARWAALVQTFVRHCLARYGADEVHRWYFEVWNEPNLHAFWAGTQAQYFAFYAATAEAIKAIDPALRVGGPATSNFHVTRQPGEPAVARAAHGGEPTPADVEALDWEPVWIADFLAYCHTHHLPVDFVSTHPYPQDFPFDDGHGRTVHVRRGVDATYHDLVKLRRLIAASPYPHAELQLTEWSSSPSSRDFAHDALPVAAYLVKENLECAGLVQALSYWTFTDVFEEKGAGNTIFHGGFGLINYQGIVKPAFHAYQFLNALGDEVLAASPGLIVTRHHRSGRLTALAYHFPAEVDFTPPTAGSIAQAEQLLAKGEPAPLRLTLAGLPPGAPLRVDTLDRTHGYAIAAWRDMGSPATPTREQTAALRQLALRTKTELFHADANGRFELARPIDPWSLVLVEQQ